MSDQSFKKQWDEVRLHRERLQNPGALVCYQTLERSWRALEAADLGLDRDGRKALNPLAAAMFYVEMGYYPPPELLLQINDSWQKYLGAGGSASLEECLIEKPAKGRGRGNFANRYYQRLRKTALTIWMDDDLKRGKSSNQTKAAETWAARFGYDVETATRLYRKATGAFRKNRGPKNPRAVDP